MPGRGSLLDGATARRDPPLVGREDELAFIAQSLDALPRHSVGQVIALSGEPGIGKSALLRALQQTARELGYTVLAGRAAEFQAELPFGMFVDAIDESLAEYDDGRLIALAAGLERDLSLVLPAFERRAPAGAAPPSVERYRAYRAVRALLSRIADDAPVVLILDDVHWADPASVELLGHLLGRPVPGRVLFACAFRPSQLSRRLDTALAAAVQEHRAIRIDLALLDAPSAHKLLGTSVAPGVRRELYRLSGGNPFFLLQLARGAAVAPNWTTPGGAPAQSIPEPVRMALAGELAALSAPALLLLQGAAVTGDPFEVPSAAAAGGVPERDAFDIVAELIASQLVHRTRIGSRFAFRHPIVRASVYQSAASGWVAQAHARLAEFLAQRGAGPSARAPHIERSAATGDRAAVALLTQAGAQSASRAPALAARWYAAALRLLPDGTDDHAERIRLLTAMAVALGGSGQLEASRAAITQVLERTPCDDPGRGALVAYCAGIEHLMGRHRRAHGRLSEAHARTAAGQASADAVVLKLELAAGGGFECRADVMKEWAQAALSTAAGIDAPALTLVAAGQVALADFFLGAPTVDTSMDRAAELFDAISDTELAERLDVGIWIGWTEAVLERYDRAIADCERVMEVSHATGKGAFLPLTVTALAWSLIRCGRLDEAEEMLNGAIDFGRLTPNLFFAIAVGLSGVIATCKGDLVAAVSAGEECVELSRTSDPGLIPGMCGLYRAIPLIELGEAEQARDSVLSRAGGPELRLMSRSGHAVAFEVLTRAELALGRVDAAENWASRARAAIHGGGLAVESAFAHRATAAVMLARGESDAAARIALDAGVRAARVGAPVEAGRCRILAARALHQADARPRAVAELEEAVRGLRRVGAHGYADEAERELRRLGRRVRRRPEGAPAGGLSSLTEREREIASLVRQGRTNREIAGVTILSERTVERHLFHIFRKLGVSNRSALASLIAEADKRT